MLKHLTERVVVKEKSEKGDKVFSFSFSLFVSYKVYSQDNLTVVNATNLEPLLSKAEVKVCEILLGLGFRVMIPCLGASSRGRGCTRPGEGADQDRSRASGC